jgi:hypothetical protein
VDLFLMVSIVLSFATLLTAHVALTAGLVARPPRVRSVVAFILLPLAPYWGFRENMRGRAITWLASLSAYVLLRVVEHATLK